MAPRLRMGVATTGKREAKLGAAVPGELTL